MMSDNFCDHGDSYHSVDVPTKFCVTALAGNYVNFGVFELYGDRALSDALDAALKMTLSIPMSDILAYRKVCKQFSCRMLLRTHSLFFKFSLQSYNED